MLHEHMYGNRLALGLTSHFNLGVVSFPANLWPKLSTTFVCVQLFRKPYQKCHRTIKCLVFVTKTNKALNKTIKTKIILPKLHFYLSLLIKFVY